VSIFKSKKALFVTVVLIGSIIAWSLLLYQYGATTIVDYIGVENGYLITFFVSLFGGMSSLSGASYVATITTLASGGLNPAYLALASGFGITIGDTIYYLIGRYGYKNIDGTWLADKIAIFSVWLLKKPRWVITLGIYIYTGFTPLPNDVLTLTIGAARFPYILSIAALTLGNITLTFLIATGAAELFSL